MGMVFAALSALTYGVADWSGGHAARRIEPLAATVIGQSASLVIVITTVVVMNDPRGGLAWGAAAGLAGLAALVCFYSALAGGAMTVVAPITAIVGLVVPVVVGVALGDRPDPLAWVGIVVAVAAVALVGGAVGATHVPVARRHLALAVVAGIGFGLFFVFLSRSPDDSGLWPLLGARVVSAGTGALVLLGRHRRSGRPFRPARAAIGLAVVAGVLDMTANLLYLQATRNGLLSLVAVVASMYPVSTIVLATTIDHERVTRSQLAGMALAVGAVVLVSIA